MKLMGYYAWHTFINSIKKIFRSKVALVIVSIIMIGVIFGVAGALIGNAVEKTQTEQSSTEQVEEEQEDDEEELTEEEIAFQKSCFEFGIPLAFLAFLLWGAYNGTKKGSDIFMMADVNFLFTAPLKPQSILMFRLSLQMVATLLGSLYLIFQIPNLVTNLHMNVFSVIAIFLAWIFLFLYQKLISVLSYTLSATYDRIKPYIRPLIIGVVILVCGVLLINYLHFERDIPQTIENTLGSKATRMIPILGWYKGMIMAAVDGEIYHSLGYMALLVVFIIVLFFIIWSIKADFYEDAFTGASMRDEMQTAALEGRNVAKKERSSRIKRNQEMKGAGASTFFWKELYNRRRFAKFGFATNTMLTYLTASLLISAGCIKILDIQNFTIIGSILAGIAFFRNFGNPIAQETEKNWLFLVPDNPYKKVFAAMMAGSYACICDLLPACIVGGILLSSNPVEVVMWIVQIVTMDFMLSAIGLMLEVLLPSSSFDLMKSMLQLILKFMAILIVIVPIVAGYCTLGILAGLIFSLIVNVLIGMLLFFIYPSLLHEGVS